MYSFSPFFYQNTEQLAWTSREGQDISKKQERTNRCIVHGSRHRSIKRHYIIDIQFIKGAVIPMHQLYQAFAFFILESK